MAIMRKKVTEPIDIVLLHDPAIDMEKSDLSAYVDDYDTEHLVYKDGLRPTIFKLKQLTEPQKDFLDRYSMETQSRTRAKWAIRFALANVDNLLTDVDGQIVPADPITFQKIHGVPGTVVKDSWLNQSGLGTEELSALMTAIVMHSEVMSPLSGQSEPRSGNGI